MQKYQHTEVNIIFLCVSIALHGKYFSTWERVKFALWKNKS